MGVEEFETALAGIEVAFFAIVITLFLTVASYFFWRRAMKRKISIETKDRVVFWGFGMITAVFILSVIALAFITAIHSQ